MIRDAGKISAPRVLIVTGTMLAVDEPSLRSALVKQVAAMRASSGPWLDLRLKLSIARGMLAHRSARKRGGLWSPTVDRLFADDFALGAPELTEVVLMTLLQAEGLPWEATTYAAISGDPAQRERLLDACPVVFASSTLLRDLSELLPMVALLKRPTNRVVVGGALAGLLPPDWPGSPHIDVLAVGEGERLINALARWIRGESLRADGPGQLRHAGNTWVLSAGPAASPELGGLPRPDWRLAERYHGRQFEHIFYESVRGCPYRCAFCNYPYLFDDHRFRAHSAERIVEDWAAYAAQGVRIITCLDSLFTVPRRRLDALCDALVARGLGIEWICYARADDLVDPNRVRRMAAAGCVQVQIGIESADADQLRRMEKHCNVADALAAVANCRDAGITTLCNFVVGFPGETAASLRATRDFILEAQPDFYHLAPFTTRALQVPVLSPQWRARYGLQTHQGVTSSQPYWRHATMSAAEVPAWLEQMGAEIAAAEASLDATLFYQTTIRYRPEDRADLLAFQRDSLQRGRLADWTVNAIGRWVQKRLEHDLERTLGPRSAQSA